MSKGIFNIVTNLFRVLNLLFLEELYEYTGKNLLFFQFHKGFRITMDLTDNLN